MKKLLLFPAALLSFTLSAQSIQLKNADSQMPVVANQTIYVNTNAAANVKTTLDIKNIGSTTYTYDAKRYDVVLNTALDATKADAYFCFAGNCYGSFVTVSQTPLVLGSNKSASDTTAAFFMLVADLDEATTVGYSVVKYTFQNTTIASDSVQIVIIYNAVIVASSFNFGQVNSASGTNDPTPVQSIPGIVFSPFSSNGNSANSMIANAFAFSGWPNGATNGNNIQSSMTGSLNTNNYYSVTVSAAPNYVVSLNSIGFDVDRSSTGSRNYAVRSSLDGYSTNLPGTINSNANLSINNTNEFFWNLDATFGTLQTGNNISLAAAPYQYFSSPITFRFYSWNSEDANGTFLLDNVLFSGKVLITTGIGQLSHNLNAGFNLYPNPSNDGIVTLETTTKNSTIEILSATGSVVMTHNNGFDNSITLDVASLQTGIYFVKISSGNTFKIEKLVISK